MLEISRLTKYPLLIDRLLKHTQRTFFNIYCLYCFASGSSVNKGA